MSRLHKIYGCDNPQRIGDVVFVHGLGDTWDGCWWHGNGKPDIEDFWPHWIGEDLGGANFSVGVWSLEYEASRSEWRGHAMELDERARNVLAEMEGLIGDRPVCFVTHSLGGLVVKQMLKETDVSNKPRWKNIASQTRGVFFLSTPHSGSTQADLHSWLGFISRSSKAIVTLQKDSEELHFLNNWFRDYYEDNREQVGIEVYYETKPIMPFGIIVDKASANPDLPGVTPIEMDDTHTSICKIASRNHKLFRNCLQFLKDRFEPYKNLPPEKRKKKRRSSKKVDSDESSDADIIDTNNHVTPVSKVSKPWNVPHRRNEYFTGRKQELDLLNQSWQAGRSSNSLQIQILSGLGGIGKTQTAVEFAYRHEAGYTAILWTLADTETSLLSGYTAVAETLGFSGAKTHPPLEVRNQVKTWLETHSGWLLVFDSADELRLLTEYLPQQRDGIGGHILITSRSSTLPGNLGSKSQVIELSNLMEEEATLFLWERVRRNPETESEDECQAASKLALSLYMFPLALEQAAAYIVQRQTTFAGYLTLYRKHELVQLEKAQPETGEYKDEQGYKSVRNTWSLNFQAVEEENEASALLLSFSAWLNPYMIPIELIFRGSPELPEPMCNWFTESNSITECVALYDELLSPLARYSLIIKFKSWQAYSIHPIVQHVLREIHQDQAPTWRNRVVLATSRAFPLPLFMMWPICERLLLQGMQAEKYILEGSERSLPAAQLLGNLAGYLNERGLYGNAIILGEQALGILRDLLPPDDSAVGTLLNNLGEFHRRLGHFERADAYYQEVLETYNRVPPDDFMQIVGARNNLALSYLDQGRYAEAESLHKQVLDDCSSLNKTDPRLATNLNNIGGLYAEQGKWAEAEPLFVRALDMRRAIFPIYHPAIAESLINLAGLYQHQGRYGDAEPLYYEALEIYSKVWPNGHPYAGKAFNSLAQLYSSQGRFVESETLFRRAISIHRQTLGQFHPSVAIALGNLAGLYQERGEYSEAESLFNQALDIQRKSLPQNLPQIAASLNNLGALYEMQGRYLEAEALFKESLEVAMQVVGEVHPDVANTRNNLAGSYESQGRYLEAEALYKQAMEIQQVALSENHPQIATNCTNLAGLYQKQARYDEADQLYQRALEIEVKIRPVGHPRIAILRNNIATLYARQGKNHEAEQLYKQVLDIQRAVFPEGHPDVAKTLSNLAQLCQSLGRYQEAETLYREALSMLQIWLGENHPSRATILGNLANLCVLQGRLSEAEQLHVQALAMLRKALPSNHTDIAASLVHLAQLYQNLKRYREAELLLDEGLAIYRVTLPDEHPDIAFCIIGLAMAYQFQGRIEAAEPLFEQAITILTKFFGEFDPNVATALTNLARIYQSQKRYVEAGDLYERALNIRRKILPESHPDIAHSLNNMGLFLHVQGRNSDAEPFLREAAGILVRAVGAVHPNTIMVITNHLMCLWALGRLKLELPQLPQEYLPILTKLLEQIEATQSAGQTLDVENPSEGLPKAS